MSEQLSFEGLEAPAQPTDRLFFALLPDAAAAGRIAALAQQLRGQHGLKGRPQAAERLHITLVYLGDFAGLPHDIVAQASAAAASVALAPFDVVLDRAMSFRRARNRPFVLHSNDPMAPLAAFQQALVNALRSAGLAFSSQREDAQFKPHVTLLYDDRSIADEPVAPVGWTARDFVLMHSLNGLAHVPLGRWPT